MSVFVCLNNLSNNLNTNKTMKNEEKKVYSTPEIEVIEVAVEQGFAASDPIDGMPYGGNNW